MKPLMKPPRSRSATTKPPVDYLWAQMDTIVGSPFVQDDEGFTIADFQERYKVGRTCAGVKLARLVAEGKLIEGKRRYARGFMKVYRPVE